jgi:hypothetical protein
MIDETLMGDLYYIGAFSGATLAETLESFYEQSGKFAGSGGH